MTGRDQNTSVGFQRVCETFKMVRLNPHREAVVYRNYSERRLLGKKSSVVVIVVLVAVGVIVVVVIVVIVVVVFVKVVDDGSTLTMLSRGK